MNKSIILFSSGVLTGAIIAASLFYYSGVSVDRLRAEALTPSSPAMAQVQKELSTILAKLELISTGVDSLGYKTYTPAMNNPSAVSAPKMSMSAPADNATTMPQESESMAAPASIQQPVASQAATPVAPSASQTEQYNSIKYRIYEAANNPDAKLSDLLKMGEQLTPEQRKELTDEVMAMIKRGELNERQFTTSQ